MHDYQLRVIAEKKELDEKLEKINKFRQTESFSKSLGNEKEKINKQVSIMRELTYVMSNHVDDF